MDKGWASPLVDECKRWFRRLMYHMYYNVVNVSFHKFPKLYTLTLQNIVMHGEIYYTSQSKCDTFHFPNHFIIPCISLEPKILL